MKIAVIFHLFYHRMYKDFQRYLNNLEGLDYDLFITMPIENRCMSTLIKNDYPNAHIVVVPNLGYDIRPFLLCLKQLNLNKYDVVFKIQTKKDIPIDCTINNIDLSGSKWREHLLNSLLGTKYRVRNICHWFATQPQIGMIGSKDLLIKGKENLAKDIDVNKVEELMLKCGYSICQWEFIAGTMFAVRASLLRKLQQQELNNLTFPDYSEIPKDWNSTPYLLERVFGMMISSQGYTVCGI